MKPAQAASDARKNLRLLAGELNVSLRGFSDDDLDIIAIRFAMDVAIDGRITTDVLQAIVDDVRTEDEPSVEAGGSEQAKVASSPDITEEPALPPAPFEKLHYLATEATNAKYLQRLALAHRTEDRRTGLYVVPRKPDPLPVDKPHPACLVAARERRGTVCDRCLWLLDDNPYVDEWLDRDDSTGGRL